MADNVDDKPKIKGGEFTVVARKKNRKTPTIRCNYRQFCQNLKPENPRCRFYHTREEIEHAKSSGVPRLRKIGLCKHEICLHADEPSKCNYAHGVEDLFCPTCNQNGHPMNDCTERDQPVSSLPKRV